MIEFAAIVVIAVAILMFESVAAKDTLPWLRNGFNVTAAITLLAAVIYWRQLSVMQGTLDEMQAEQRAWLSIVEDPKAGESPAVAEPLELDANGLRVGLRFTLRNTGKNPAVEALAKIGATVSHLPGRQWEQEICNELPGIGVSIFPGDASPFAAGTSVKSDEIDRAPSGLLQLFVGACVVYRDAVTGKWHHTPYAYQIVLQSGRVFSKAQLPLSPSDVSVGRWIKVELPLD